MDKELTPEERIARRRAQREAEQQKEAEKKRRESELLKAITPVARAPVPPASQATDQSERNLAEAWARSTGLVDIPPKPHRFNGWICFILAWFWLIPAIVYYFWCEARANAYAESMNQALRTWKANGSPDPYAPTRSAQVSPPVAQEQGLSSKLQELSELKAKGLLSEEEFAAAKKKILGI